MAKVQRKLRTGYAGAGQFSRAAEKTTLIPAERPLSFAEDYSNLTTYRPSSLVSMLPLGLQVPAVGNLLFGKAIARPRRAK